MSDRIGVVEISWKSLKVLSDQKEGR